MGLLMSKKSDAVHSEIESGGVGNEASPRDTDWLQDSTAWGWLKMEEVVVKR